MLPRAGRFIFRPIFIRLLLVMILVLLMAQEYLIYHARASTKVSDLVGRILAEETSRPNWLRMAVHGDPHKLVTGYQQRLDQMSALTHEITTLDPDPVLHQALQQARHQQRLAINHEFAIIKLVLTGRQMAALEALESSSYHQALHKSAAGFSKALLPVQMAQSQQVTQVLWLTGICTLAMVLCGLLFQWLAQRLERRQVLKMRRAQELLNLRAVMASVMDAFNNFLNASLLFRLRAESRALTEAELAEFDEASEKARDQLLMIANTTVIRTRDMGGIQVMATPTPTKNSASFVGVSGSQLPARAS